METHLVVSQGARATIGLETELSVDEVEALADVVHSATDLAAPVSSGSFVTLGMAVVPCSIRRWRRSPTATPTTSSRGPRK